MVDSFPPTKKGKTRVLIRLREMGHQIIDLEGMANHMGSTFGSLPYILKEIEQPSNEMYVNIVASEWVQLDPTKWIFVEDEVSLFATSLLMHYVTSFTPFNTHTLFFTLEVPYFVVPSCIYA
jgi:tRNA 2-selenouridine synthase